MISHNHQIFWAGNDRDLHDSIKIRKKCKKMRIYKIIMKKKSGMMYKKNRIRVEESTKHKNNWRQNIFFNTIDNTIIKLSLGL